MIECTPPDVVQSVDDWETEWPLRSTDNYIVVAGCVREESRTSLEAMCNNCGPEINNTIEIHEILSGPDSLLKRGQQVSLITGFAAPCSFPVFLCANPTPDPPYLLQISKNLDHYQAVPNQWNQPWAAVQGKAVISAALDVAGVRCCLPPKPYDDPEGPCRWTRTDGTSCNAAQHCCPSGVEGEFECCATSDQLCNAQHPAPADLLPLQAQCYDAPPCTEETISCANGAEVGRQFPVCDFAECPGLQVCGTCCLTDGCEGSPDNVLDFSLPSVCCKENEICCGGRCCDSAVWECESDPGAGTASCVGKRSDPSGTGGVIVGQNGGQTGSKKNAAVSSLEQVTGLLLAVALAVILT